MDIQGTCSSCNTVGDLFSTECLHLVLCGNCGRSLAHSKNSCKVCGKPIERLVKEFAVRTNPSSKGFFLGKFPGSLPGFDGKKKKENCLWSMQKEGLQGKLAGTEAAKEKLKLKPWILEDDLGQRTYKGQPDMGQAATYFLLVMHGKGFLTMPVNSWYNFSKQKSYKTYTIEEAEEVMKGNRRKKAELHSKWLQKVGRQDEEDGGGGSSRAADGGRKHGDDDEEEDEEEERDSGRKDGTKKKFAVKMDEQEDEAATKEDMDNEEEVDRGEKGEEWEHEETFTDDDEAVGNDKDEREENDTAPRALKENDEDEDEEDESGDEPSPDGAGGDGKFGVKSEIWIMTTTKILMMSKGMAIKEEETPIPSAPSQRPATPPSSVTAVSKRKAGGKEGKGPGK